MQLLGNFYEYYLKKNNKEINVIVATSGDTGAAAIDAIKGKKNMNIFVLHPHNKISSVQRKLMSTVRDKNVFNIARPLIKTCSKLYSFELFLVLIYFIYD